MNYYFLFFYALLPISFYAMQEEKQMNSHEGIDGFAHVFQEECGKRGLCNDIALIHSTLQVCNKAPWLRSALPVFGDLKKNQKRALIAPMIFTGSYANGSSGGFGQFINWFPYKGIGYLRAMKKVFRKEVLMDALEEFSPFFTSESIKTLFAEQRKLFLEKFIISSPSRNPVRNASYFCHSKSNDQFFSLDDDEVFSCYVIHCYCYKKNDGSFFKYLTLYTNDVTEVCENCKECGNFFWTKQSEKEINQWSSPIIISSLVLQVPLLGKKKGVTVAYDREVHREDCIGLHWIKNNIHEEAVPSLIKSIYNGTNSALLQFLLRVAFSLSIAERVSDLLKKGIAMKTRKKMKCHSMYTLPLRIFYTRNGECRRYRALYTMQLNFLPGEDFYLFICGDRYITPSSNNNIYLGRRFVCNSCNELIIDTMTLMDVVNGKVQAFGDCFLESIVYEKSGKGLREDERLGCEQCLYSHAGSTARGISLLKKIFEIVHYTREGEVGHSTKALESVFFKNYKRRKKAIQHD